MARPLSLAILFTSALLEAGCAADTPDEDVAADDAEIVAGVRSGPADDAVVHVFAGKACTGVLVGRSLVMTALHCVSRDIASASAHCGSTATPMAEPVRAGAIRVSVGSSIFALRQYGVRSVVTGPSRRMCNGDVAVLVLSEPVTDVTPLAIRETPLRVGESLTAIGWGADANGRLSDYRKRRTGIKVLDTGGGAYFHEKPDGTVVAVTSGSKEVVTGESTCQGDSGGPLLDANRRVAAIVSRSQRGCLGLSIKSDASYWQDLVDDARDLL